MFRNYSRHYEIYRDISNVWDEIRGFAETSSISKSAEGIWGFTFSYCKSKYFRLVLATITGKVKSKGDNYTTLEIKSHSFSGRVGIVGFILMIILVSITNSLGLSILIKTLLVIGVILGFTLLTYQEIRANIDELEQKLNISK